MAGDGAADDIDASAYTGSLTVTALDTYQYPLLLLLVVPAAILSRSLL